MACFPRLLTLGFFLLNGSIVEHFLVSAGFSLVSPSYSGPSSSSQAFALLPLGLNTGGIE